MEGADDTPKDPVEADEPDDNPKAPVEADLPDSTGERPSERRSRYQIAREREQREASKLPVYFSETLIFAGVLCIIAAVVAAWGTVPLMFDGRGSPFASLIVAASLVCFAAGISLIAMGGRDTRKKD